MIYLGPNLLKVTRMKVLLTLNLADNSIAPKTFHVDQQFSLKFIVVNFKGCLPFNQSIFNRDTTAVATTPGRTNPQASLGMSCGTVCTSARGDHRFGMHCARPERRLCSGPSPSRRLRARERVQQIALVVAHSLDPSPPPSACSPTLAAT